MSAEREREYQELYAYLKFYVTHVADVGPTDPGRFAADCERIVQQFGKSKALEGLRQAANDTVEALNERPAEFIAQLDTALRNAKIITASEVRLRYSSSYKRIVKRGSIRNETEYYIINGIVADSGNLASEELRAELQRLLEAYERGA